MNSQCMFFVMKSWQFIYISSNIKAIIPVLYISPTIVHCMPSLKDAHHALNKTTWTYYMYLYLIHLCILGSDHLDHYMYIRLWNELNKRGKNQDCFPSMLCAVTFNPYLPWWPPPWPLHSWSSHLCRQGPKTSADLQLEAEKKIRTKYKPFDFH